MIWYICFIISLAIMLLSAGYCIYLLFSRYKRRRISGLRVCLASCFIAGTIVTVPAHFELYAAENTVWVKTIVLSVQKAIRVFGADGLYEAVFDTIGKAPQGLGDAYIAVTLAVQFIAPLLTFGFLLSFFKNVSAYILYGISYFRDVYVFSELNEKSLVFARDILKNHKRARIVFADVNESKNKDVSELTEDAKELGAICFKKDISSINFSFHSDSSKIYFFTIGNDEMENVDNALKLIDSYNLRENTHLYVFSTGVKGELLLSGRERGQMRVRRIDETRSLISRILYEEGYSIFENALPIEESGEKQISAVIVGLGAHGTEMLKSLAWYCQMDGYHVKINAFDKDKLAEKRFSASCPELMSPEYNGVCVSGEAEYSITITPDCDVSTKDFADKISAITDATYVFVSLGTDELNIQTAANLRMLFERNGAKPTIHAIITGAEVRESLSKVKNIAGQDYNIDFIGDLESSYTENVIINNEVEESAFAGHKAYCDGDPDKEEDFWRYEYCYRSSMASTIHVDARVKCGVPGADKSENELTEDEADVIASIEHRRWNAYMRSEGFVYSGSPEKSTRNDLAKMHHNLVVYSDLSEDDIKKDIRVGAKK